MNKPQRSASRTAIGVATLRAMHELYDGDPKILSDPIIAMLLGDEILGKATADLNWLQDPVMAALRSHVVLRSRYTEDYLHSAVDAGIRQYVSLGSGFDTFAYRQPPWASVLRIYEVDHAASQAAKIDRLHVSGLSLPANLEFVAADFESSSLREILSRSTLRLHAATFFSCLGVLIYLPESSIRSIFEFIGTFPKGSQMVFTFSQGDYKEAMKPLIEAAAEVGEPWRTYHTPEQLTQLSMSTGFSVIEFLSPDEAKERYYHDRKDNLPPPRRASIARVIV